MKLIKKINYLKPGFYVITFLLFYCLFTYKLLTVPPGINFDESSIGYNAVLISKNLRDQNNDLLPVFVLTLDGKDYKQPVNIYTAALIFKVLGISYFNLKLMSVLFALISGFVFFKILRLFFSELISFAGLLLYFTSPSIMIQSHLILENIAILPFFMVWLYFLLSYSIRPKRWKLLVSGIFLGIDFYAYKGARALVPVYFLLSVVYLFYINFYTIKIKNNVQKIKLILLEISFFLLGSLPFLLPAGYLNKVYAGAVFDRGGFSIPSFYESANIFFTNMDFSFLFIKGDLMLVHSTQRHGVFLAPTFFLFFLGLFEIAREKKHQYYFILLTLLLTPILFIGVGSHGRASRLMTYIPLFTFIFCLGIKNILEIKHKLLKTIIIVVFGASLVYTYYDFVSFYWVPYPKRISGDFSPNFNGSLKSLRQWVDKTHKSAYIEYGDFLSHKGDIQLFWQIYFPHESMKFWERDVDSFPADGIVLSGIGKTKETDILEEIPSIESGQRTFYIIGKK